MKQKLHGFRDQVEGSDQVGWVTLYRVQLASERYKLFAVKTGKTSVKLWATLVTTLISSPQTSPPNAVETENIDDQEEPNFNIDGKAKCNSRYHYSSRERKRSLALHFYTVFRRNDTMVKTKKDYPPCSLTMTGSDVRSRTNVS